MSTWIGYALGVVILAGSWAIVAALAGYLAHRRMRSAEAQLGRPAVPQHEQSLLWLALASVGWPTAAVVAFAGLVNKSWARLGRNATFVLLAHLSLALAAATTLAFWDLAHPPLAPRSAAEDMLPIIAIACSLLALGVAAASVLAWHWAGRRRDRLRRAVAQRAAPGAWRYGLYAASLFLWPVGIAGLLAFSSSHDAHVGTIAFRCTLANLLAISLGVCVGAPTAWQWLVG